MTGKFWNLIFAHETGCADNKSMLGGAALVVNGHGLAGASTCHTAARTTQAIKGPTVKRKLIVDGCKRGEPDKF